MTSAAGRVTRAAPVVVAPSATAWAMVMVTVATAVPLWPSAR
jgi:hypothetical protein